MAWHRFTLTDPPMGWTAELDRAVERALGLRRWSAPTARLKLGLAYTWDGSPDVRAARALGGQIQEVDGPPAPWGHEDKPFLAAWSAYRAALAARAPEATRLLRPPAAADDVEALWARAEAPSPLLGLLALHDGEDDAIGGGVFPTWRPLSVVGMLSAKEFLDTLHADPGSCTADRGVQPVWWCKGWLPWATNGGGDYLVLDLDPAPGGLHGQVVYFGHADDYREVFAPSLTDAISVLTNDLERGELKVLEEADGSFWCLAYEVWGDLRARR